MQDEEYLSFSKQNKCWAPCLILSIAWRIITSSEILKNNWRMKRILDDPPCRASMKNSGNKRMIERKRSWKHKVKPCNDLDGALRWYNRENMELRKEKMNTRTENYFIMNNLRKKRIESPRGNKNKIYCMLILHQIKLMTSNGFLHTTYSSWKRLRSDISQTWECLCEPSVGLERMNELIW